MPINCKGKGKISSHTFCVNINWNSISGRIFGNIYMCVDL